MSQADVILAMCESAERQAQSMTDFLTTLTAQGRT